MSANIIEACNLYYKYGDGTLALQGIDLDIKKHSKTAILGANGAGKTTLFLNCNGLLKPSQGQMRYAGSDYNYSAGFLKELKRKVGIVFQNPDNQLFSASVRQDISFGLMNLGFNRKEAEYRINRVGDELRITELFAKATHFLSLGQKKLVALAGVLVMDPEILICDEPTAGLDPANSQLFMQALDEQHQQGTTLVISTHDVDLAYSWADTIIVMGNGRVLSAGSPRQVLDNQELLNEAHLQKPWILEIWQELQLARIVSPLLPAPRHKEQLMQIIRDTKETAGDETTEKAPFKPPGTLP
ncbi:ABC transporter-like [Syntrophomonas zehnderi OL-4]|uniref:ABC transporter ATP-binding protein n=1 Tax=Syntrophomonas zehnderi OL-4 TaxID=690567 RepID=A0A0E4C9F4_9FIRM|nr:ATP-binding cassette domain-containing protein [Syntrophomonas zehnderi]CFX98018.1 ABC transporter-like [Syntrophomonas zehnderi OL-4]